jgi:protein O-GlcNAc transferase
MNSLKQAVRSCQAGNYRDAERHCLDILSGAPEHRDALNLLAEIYTAAGALPLAVDCLVRLTQTDPRDAAAHRRLANARLESGAVAQAISHYRVAIGLEPGNVRAHNNLARALARAGDAAGARASYRQALALDPEYAVAHHNLGDLLAEQGDLAQAVQCYQRAVALNPNFAEALAHGASAMLRLGRAAEALQYCDLLLAILPNSAEALNSRGNALLQLGRPEEALECIDKALKRQPHLAEAHNNRGHVLRYMERPREALFDFDRALALRPDLAQTHFNRGNVQLSLLEPAAAMVSFAQAVELQPSYAEALYNLGDTLRTLGQFEAAARQFDALTRVSPDYSYALGNLFHCRAMQCDWRDHAATTERLVTGSRREELRSDAFTLLSVTDSAEDQLTCARRFVSFSYPAKTPRWTGDPYRHERIRVAYVSADLREHAVSFLLAGVLESHDRNRFETFGISLRPEEATPMGQRVKNAFSRFIDVSALGDRGIAELMRDLEVDIAVDLVGFTGGMRPAIFAQRPAPIQVNYLGYPGTTGADYMDYILADDFVIPPEQERHYSERVAYLPECFQANDDRRLMSEAAQTRAAAGLPEQSFVFCSFNNSYKINPTLFDIWMRLLNRVAGSVLWLLGQDDVTRLNLRTEAERRGVDASRLIFARREDYPEHLARLPLADLFLDSLPFGAGATASDAIWAGLPVLTCAGRAFASRMAGSLLRTMEMPELITQDLGQYENRAMELVQRPEELRALRRRLAEKRASTALFDTDRFRRHLESAYEHMWLRHQRREIPESFRVPRPPAV